jgi:hypothetical protein
MCLVRIFTVTACIGTEISSASHFLQFKPSENLHFTTTPLHTVAKLSLPMILFDVDVIQITNKCQHMNRVETKKETQINDKNTVNENNIFDILVQCDIA